MLRFSNECEGEAVRKAALKFSGPTYQERAIMKGVHTRKFAVHNLTLHRFQIPPLYFLDLLPFLQITAGKRICAQISRQDLYDEVNKAAIWRPSLIFPTDRTQGCIISGNESLRLWHLEIFGLREIETAVCRQRQRARDLEFAA